MVLIPSSKHKIVANIPELLHLDIICVPCQDVAVHLLGLHPSTLRGKMKKLGIPYGKTAIGLCGDAHLP